MDNPPLHYPMYYGTDGGKAQAWCGAFIPRDELHHPMDDDSRICRACKAAYDGALVKALEPAAEESKP